MRASGTEFGVAPGAAPNTRTRLLVERLRENKNTPVSRAFAGKIVPGRDHTIPDCHVLVQNF